MLPRIFVGDRAEVDLWGTEVDVLIACLDVALKAVKNLDDQEAAEQLDTSRQHVVCLRADLACLQRRMRELDALAESPFVHLIGHDPAE